VVGDKKMNLDLLLSNLGVSKAFTQDVSLLIIIALISFVFGTFIGRHRLITILINIYVAVSLLSVIPKNTFGSYTYELLAFLAIVVGMTFLGKKLFEINISGAGTGFLWRVFILSFLEVVLIISIIFTIIPKKDALSYVSQTAYGYLTGDWLRFIWMAAPLAFMFIIHKRLNR
jgi:hypothetical protein